MSISLQGLEASLNQVIHQSECHVCTALPCNRYVTLTKKKADLMFTPLQMDFSTLQKSMNRKEDCSVIVTGLQYLCGLCYKSLKHEENTRMAL